MNGSYVVNRSPAPSTCATVVAGLFGILVTAGCAGVKAPPPGAQPQSAPQLEVRTPAAAPANPSTSSVAVPSGTTRAAPANPSSSPPTIASQTPTKADAPGAKAPAKSSAPKAPSAQPPKTESVAPVIAKPTSPPLNLTTLEQRLKETSAIGVLTKIALKNQVNDLLDQFRAFYQGKLKTTLAELRRPYDLLVLKVLSLLQDTDPPLASAIASSREAIWGILADREKFATVS